MANRPPSRKGPRSSSSSQTIADRVRARVSEAALAVDRRTGSTRRKPATPAMVDKLAASVTRTPAQVREVRSLRWVFRDLGRSYRRYRRQTGAPISADVRDAARKFRQELTVPALVVVAACLDELDILTW
jgi:tRNA C32,U32 (ribose-2'-O)-methylase TrmJ